MSTPMMGIKFKRGSWLAVVAISKRLVVGFNPYAQRRAVIARTLCQILTQDQAHKPAPARTLDTRSGGVELLFESIEGTEVLDDGLAEGTILQGTAGTTVGAGLCQILPEQRVVDVSCNVTMKGRSATQVRHEIKSDKASVMIRSQMYKILTTTVEFQSSLQANSLFGGGSFLVSLGRGVEGVDVSLVVFLVVERHDLLRDVGLESIVLVRQGWQSKSHLSSRCCVVDGKEEGSGGQLVYK